MRLDIEANLDSGARGIALRNLAKVLSWAGKSEDSAHAAQRALKLLGSDSESLFILALHASSVSDHGQAVAYLREALRSDPTWIKAQHNLAIELAKIGRDAEALSAYDRVLAIAPDHHSARFNRANLLARRRDFDEAIVDYSEVLSRNPADRDARFNLADTYDRAGRLQEALSEYRALAVSEPLDREAVRKGDRLAARLDKSGISAAPASNVDSARPHS
jgi:tetratricopeptide (TPR) repeat protein